jgi:hypothetical protein
VLYASLSIGFAYEVIFREQMKTQDASTIETAPASESVESLVCSNDGFGCQGAIR